MASSSIGSSSTLPPPPSSSGDTSGSSSTTGVVGPTSGEGDGGGQESPLPGANLRTGNHKRSSVSTDNTLSPDDDSSTVGGTTTGTTTPTQSQGSALPLPNEATMWKSVLAFVKCLVEPSLANPVDAEEEQTQTNSEPDDLSRLSFASCLKKIGTITQDSQRRGNSRALLPQYLSRASAQLDETIDQTSESDSHLKSLKLAQKLLVYLLAKEEGRLGDLKTDEWEAITAAVTIVSSQYGNAFANSASVKAMEGLHQRAKDQHAAMASEGTVSPEEVSTSLESPLSYRTLILATLSSIPIGLAGTKFARAVLDTLSASVTDSPAADTSSSTVTSPRRPTDGTYGQ